ncbi:allophanate hydrolase subunit 1 [Nocardioides sp. S-58]|uniref:Allophanate hydrolase subunit 1 n=1 Tax=Nocardioides renjunii TaxID=3095075 RepID=A0ABU5KAN4_9ACTN|nr:allophanate hydrolase subunit 1 [Nocardioides sp. S-58]MDZ5661924.1 allophanate hydrolase subunit 1 [Nocardioides sp. S-58]
MRVITVGARACLVEVGGAVEAASLAAWLRTSGPDHGLAPDEVVPAATTVLLDGVDPAPVQAVLAHWAGGPAGGAGPLVRLPVTYDGPDLEAVAGHWGCSAGEVVDLHTSVELVAVFSGFAPGFTYLSGLPRTVPRLATPRARVAPGSVALADTWCGIYPTASPGGWQLIGSTDVVLWDATRDPPALLPPGARVRFEAVG